MSTPVYTSPFTGTVVTPTDVSYSQLSFSSGTKQLFWPSIVNQGIGETPATRIIDVICTAPTSYLITSNTGTTFTTSDGTDALANLTAGTQLIVGGTTTITVSSVAASGSSAIVTFTPNLGSASLSGTYANLKYPPSILLPEGIQGTVGADILFRNLGAFPFAVAYSDGTNAVTIAAGIAQYFYLTNNSTTAGTWGNVTFGAGTSVANAASLAGAGLSVSTLGLLQTSQNIVDISASPSITDSSRAITYVWTSGAGTLTLPALSSLSAGWYIAFRNNGTGALTINTTSSQTINTGTSIVTNPGDSGFIFYDNTSSSPKFVTVGWVQPNNVVFTSATYDVDSISGNTLSLVSFAPIIQTYVAQTGARTQTLAVTLPAITQLYIIDNATNHSTYAITFQCQGSSSSPYTVASGKVVALLSDGTNLYPLVASSSTSFQAINGTAAAPSYSFISDNASGMYLDNTGILGLSAGGTELVRIDNSNSLSPLVTVNARLYATTFSGGTF